MSIHIKKSHRGLLHKNLGIPEGKKIPASKLVIKSSDSAAVRKRKTFAKNARGWKKGQSGLTLLQEEDAANELRDNQQMQDYYNQPPINPILPAINLSTLPGSTTPTKLPSVTQPELLEYNGPKKKGKSPINWGQAALTGLMAIDALIPAEKSQYPVVRPTQSYNEHPYGTGSQAIADHGITISKTGYKASSKDKNKPKLRIPSGNITMDGVGFPVLGTDNLGNTQYMLPGNNYQFPGKYVDEIPMAQDGTTMQPAEIDYFNGFIDYVKQKGLQGSKKLNKGNLNEQLYSEYQKTNPSISLPLKDLTQKAQYTQHQQKNFDVNFAQRKGLPNASSIQDASISPIDNYFGSETSMRPIPKASLTTLHNNTLLGTQDLGYVPTALDTMKSTKKAIPKGVKLETLQGGQFYEDPNTGDLIKYGAGGTLSASKAKEMLKDGTAHGKKLSSKQKKYFQAVSHGWKPKAEDGITILDENTVKFNGPSHEDGGQPIQYGEKMVEVEGEETGYLSPIDQSLTVMGNLKNPLTGRKFKSDSKILSEKEAKMDTLLDEGLSLIKENNPMDKWESLKFNAGKVMAYGAHQKKQELTSSKEHLKSLQEAMLETIAPQNTAKNGITIAQQGTTVSGIHPRFQSSLAKMLEEAPDFVKAQGYHLFSGYRTNSKQKSLWEGSDKSGKYVAQPGHSAHEFGLAGDIEDKNGKRLGKGDKKAMEWINQNAPNYGLNFRMKHEPWHIELAPDDPSLSWVGDYKPENYDTIPDNNIPVKRTPYTGKRNPTGSRVEEVSSAEKYDPGRVRWQDVKVENPVEPKKSLYKDYNPTSDFKNPEPYNMPTNAQGLEFTQILPELYAAATNKVEPVHMQKYQPELYEPYQISYQDQLNENQATFSATQKAAAYNPSALATLAGQKYSADSSVLANEFRTNQGIANEITNKNIALLNDAELKNLQLADTQYTRQSQAKSNTKAINHQILNSISSKVLQNKANQNKTKLYENLYRYRFDPENNLQAYNAGPHGNEYIDYSSINSGGYGENPYQSTSVRKNASGQVLGSTTSIPSQKTQQLTDYSIQQKKLKPISSLLSGQKQGKMSFADWLASQSITD